MEKNIILVTGSVLTSDKESIEIYESLEEILNNNDYQVYTPLDTMKFKGNDFERYERAMDMLQSTRLMIAEMSNVSTGQGMEIQQAVILGIPILVIAKNNSKVSGLVKGCGNVRNIIYYEDINDISDRIKKFIEEELNEKHSNNRR